MAEETEFAMGATANCADGPGGTVSRVLLQEGHLWGRKKVSSPVSAVTGVENGIQLSLTRKQVEDLPPAD